MKAAVRTKYGPPQVLSIQEVEKPVPKDDEVLIKIYAVTVNRTDYAILWGKPSFSKIVTGWPKPKITTTGSDFAGVIEAVGAQVKMFKVGDRVMGFSGMGCKSHAEYITFPEAKGISTIPAQLSFEQAAASMEGAFYASVGMKHLQPHSEQKALVYGATGAIGSATLQFLKERGVYVTAVCGGENKALVKSLGADKIYDYKTEDFTKDNERYDFIFDTVLKKGFFKCKHLLKKKGIYSWSDGLINIPLALITPLFGGKKVVFYIPKDVKEGIHFIKEMIEKKSFRPLIDRNYSLDNIVEAFEYVGSGQKIGNVIIKMDV